MLLEDLSDISYESSNTLVAANPTATTIGNASGTVLKGGLTTITVRATAGGKELTATTDITVINLIVKDGAGHDVPATGNIVVPGDTKTLTAVLEGIPAADVSYEWTSSDSSKITVSPSLGASTTLTGIANDTADITVTTTYGGNDYAKTMAFRGQIGSKAAPDAVGDIVFSDGSAEAYSADLTLSEAQKAEAIAVIFGTTTKWGVGLMQGTNLAWAADGTTGYSMHMNTLGSSLESGSNAGNAEFIGTGHMGSTSLGQFKFYIGVADDEPLSLTDYGAWAFVEGYAAAAGLTGTTYEDGWYMPGIQELCYLYQVKDTVNSALGKIAGAQMTAGGHWSSTTSEGSGTWTWRIDFGTGNLVSNGIRSDGASVCVIRAF